LCFVGPSFGVVAAVACIVARVAWTVLVLASVRIDPLVAEHQL